MVAVGKLAFKLSGDLSQIIMIISGDLKQMIMIIFSWLHDFSLLLQVAQGEIPLRAANGYNCILFLPFIWPFFTSSLLQTDAKVALCTLHCREEISKYKELDPIERLLILKALCELRVEVDIFLLITLYIYFYHFQRWSIHFFFGLKSF